MLTSKQATQIVEGFLPGWKIQSYVEYKDLYLFKVFNDDPYEGEMDPFFSVNKKTGEFLDFSIFTDGDMSELEPLFAAAEA